MERNQSVTGHMENKCSSVPSVRANDGKALYIRQKGVFQAIESCSLKCSQVFAAGPSAFPCTTTPAFMRHLRHLCHAITEKARNTREKHESTFPGSTIAMRHEASPCVTKQQSDGKHVFIPLLVRPGMLPLLAISKKVAILVTSSKKNLKNKAKTAMLFNAQPTFKSSQPVTKNSTMGWKKKETGGRDT
jgi:hypothetical protein